jgi:hypothetical protein
VLQLETFEKGCIKKAAFDVKYKLFGLFGFDELLLIRVSLRSQVSM